MERMYWTDAAFVTLTYADEFLPPTLKPEDLQKYFKRLRRDLPGRPIKFFACGEYGSAAKGRRPHYHAIIFGLSPVADRKVIQENWPYCDWQALEETERGRRAIGNVTFGSCHYVAGYVMKKLVGEKAKEVYDANGVVAPFVRMSKGLGLSFALDNKELLTKSLQIGFSGYCVALPRYFRDKLGISPELLKARHYDRMVDKMKDCLQRHPWLAKAPEDTIMHVIDVETYGRKYERDAKQRELDLKRKNVLNSDNDEYDIF